MYILIEIQSDGETAATVVNTYADKPHADQAFHQILAAAAVSEVKYHSAVMLTHDGQPVYSEGYTHEEVEA